MTHDTNLPYGGSWSLEAREPHGDEALRAEIDAIGNDIEQRGDTWTSFIDAIVALVKRERAAAVADKPDILDLQGGRYNG